MCTEHEEEKKEAQCIMGDRSCSYTAYSFLHKKEAFTDDFTEKRALSFWKVRKKSEPCDRPE